MNTYSTPSSIIASSARPNSGNGQRKCRGTLLAIAGLIGALSIVGVGPTVAHAAIAPVPLGLTTSFGVVTPTTFTGNGATTIRGDIGAATVVFPTGTHIGEEYTPPDLAPILADLTIAYNNAKNRAAGPLLAADLAGVTVGPGVWTSAAAVGMTAAGVFTIDGENDPDAVFILQVKAAMSLGAGIQMNLIRGAQAKNVFWQVDGAATIGAGSRFVGTVMANGLMSSLSSNVINGRLMSISDSITVASNNVYSNPPSVTIDDANDDDATDGEAYSTDSSPLITGTTSARSPSSVTVTISVGGVVDQTSSVTPSGTGIWSYQSAELMNDEYTIIASSTDEVGNVGSATQLLEVDTVLPVVLIDNGPTAASNDSTPTITGTTDITPGELVTVVFTLTTQTITRTTLAQADQSWSVTPTVLSEGNWTVVATVRDPAGNESIPVPQILSIDATAPALFITSSTLTNDSTPLVTGLAEVGSTVTVAIDGSNVAPVTRAADVWSATYAGAALGDGTHNVSVTARDAAGNTVTQLQVLTVDTLAPAITILPGATDATNDLTPTIAGTTAVAAGVIVSVSIDGGSAMTGLVQGDGSWNVTPGAPLAAGTVIVVATVADPAGNIGSFTQTLNLDVTVPIVTIVGGPSRVTADATPTISGSASAAPTGSVVTVQVDGQSLPTTIAAGGTFTVTTATIANGPYVVSVTVTDPAGNIGSANQNLQISAVSPTVAIAGGSSAATSDDTPILAGTTNAPAGSSVSVAVDGQTLQTFVQSGGSWNVTAAHIENSTVTVVVSVTDTDGNVGSATQSLSVDSTTPTPIAIDGGATRSTNDATPTISGTTGAADGRTVTVTVNGQTTPTAASNGRWSVTAANLGDAMYTVNVAVAAVGGSAGAASQSLTVDTVAPVVVVTGGSSISTTDSTPPISGTGVTPGSAVRVTVGGQVLTATVASNGTWTVTPSVALPLGSNTALITITDAAGNTGIGTQAISVGEAPPTTQPPTTEPPTTEPPTTELAPEFVSVGPKRVFDTRPGQSLDALRTVAKTPIGGAVELQVHLTNLAAFVPATGVGAVSLNVTSTGATASGYITVYACGTREVVSSVNFAAGHTVANAVITPVSVSGMVCFYSNTATDLIVDINGWFAAGAAFTPVGPKRVFDTRSESGSSVLRTVPATRVAAGGMLEVKLTDLPGYVPAAGVAAVSLNVVVANPDGAGYITVYACGERAVVSSVNYVAGQTVANAVIAPVSSSGTVCFYSLQAADLIVDINGWLATGSAFHALNPARILDTRSGQSPDALRDVREAKIGGGNVLEVRVTDLADRVPAGGVSAVSLNVTATNPDGTGYITVYACGRLEAVSSVNFDAEATVANAVMAPVSATGTICLYSNVTTDVIVDINGWIATAQGG